MKGLVSSGLRTAVGQGLSSATNLVLSVGLASALPARSFGTLVATLSIYFLAQAAVRAAVGDVLLSQVGERWRSARRMAWAIGVAAGSATAVAALLVPVEATAVGVLAAVMPLLVLNEAMRYRSWASGSAGAVIVMDGVWLLVAASGTVLLLLGSDARAWELIGVWGGGGVAATLVGWRALSGLQDPGGSDSQVAVRRARRGFLGDQLPQAIATSALPILLAVVVSADVAGAHRAALLPFMLAETALHAVRVTTLPALRAGATGGRREIRARVTAVQGAVAVAACAPAAVLSIPSIREVLGDAGALVGWWFVAAGALVVARAVGRASADTVAMVRGLTGTGVVRTGSAVLELLGAAAAGVAFGLPGVLLARLVVVASTSLLWWRVADRAGVIDDVRDAESGAGVSRGARTPPR